MSLVTWKVRVCPDSFAGPGEIAVAQRATVCGAGVLEHRLVRALGEARRVVDRRLMVIVTVAFEVPEELVTV